MDWDKLRVFHAVADAGSLTHAGDTLHLSQSAVSRQIKALEDSLQATLFHRHARGLVLTEQGELLFDATTAMQKRLDAASARIRDSEDEVQGELKVTTTLGFGTLWLAPRLSHLFENFPELQIDLRLEERVLDLPMREADVAIRMKEPSQADLIRKKLMTVRMRLYATSEYLQSKNPIDTLEDIRSHRLICQAPSAFQVAAGATLVQHLLTFQPQSTLLVNNYFGGLQAMLSHLGVAVLPSYVIEDFPNLVRVLPDVESAEVPVFLAYPAELRRSRKIAAFRDFVEDEVIAHRHKLREKGIAP